MRMMFHDPEQKFILTTFHPGPCMTNDTNSN